MRFDRLGIIGLIEEAKACSATRIFLRSGSKPLFRIGSVLVISRFSIMSRGDGLHVEKMLARESGALDGSTNEVTQNDFVCSMGDSGRLRVSLVRGHDGIAIELNLIPAEIPSLGSIGLPAGGGIAHCGGSLTLIGGYKSKQVGVALISDYCKRKASSVVTIESGIEYDLQLPDSWVVQQSLGREVCSVAVGVSSLNGGNVDLLYIEGLTERSDTKTVIELAEQGVDIIVSLKCGALDSLESAFMSLVGDCILDANRRVESLLGNQYTFGRSKVEATLKQESPMPAVLSVNRAG